ncbi:hypothetical protein TRFO_39225 [Tritrichomonas foetus]|uniref:VPS9 domain-containing protein n=1 Tax=Tritrichomonas foetus TaxID=1144522 RepID=A0A1J4J5R5_9EUKA|nr:hypothetical protein TRFO_39225 [Tritrichomonas foetus]|eukprot:OHS94584.1 hypothetical protein TRFO_39225 [Tritrichomonas foetus]
MTEIRPLISYHEECREIDTTRTFQLSEISSARRDLLNKAKTTQEKRCLTSLRSGYCLRMTSQNVRDFVLLPFIRPDGFFVNDKLVHTLGPLKNDVNAFIRSIYSHPDLPKVFAQVSNDTLLDLVPFLPAKVKPRDFLACSTLPALFGHCWSLELRHSYINFLMEVAKNLPQNVFTNFREHWLFECFKNYIHASKIHHFLKLSIGDTMLQLVRENSTHSTRLTKYASDMISRMKDNISAFPQDVRLLLKKFSDLAPTEAQKMSRIEILFIDCILIPAISLPKAYCVLPPSYQLNMSPNGPTKTLNSLAQHLRLILHPTQASLRNIPERDIEDLKKVPFADFLKKLVDIDEEKTDILGPKVTKLMSLLQTDTLVLLFTMSDICLLAKILNGDKLVSREKIPVDKEVNFEFFRYDLQNVDTFKNFDFEKPEIIYNQVEKVEKNELNDASYALFKFLTNAQIYENIPEKLNEYIQFYEEKTKLHKDYKTYSYLNHLVLKLKNIEESQYDEVLIHLQDDIRRHNEYIERNNLIMTRIARMMEQLDAEIVSYNEKADHSYPIIYSALLQLFLENEKTLETNAIEKKDDMMTKKSVFDEFFTNYLIKLKNFIMPIASYTLTGVAIHFHTWLMQMMPLRDFIEMNPSLSEGDERLTIVTKETIDIVCVKPAPKKLSNIFAHPPLFDFIEIELRGAEFVEIPLEAVSYISSAINLIQRMFDLAIGGAPQADEMTPLLNYSLLSSGLNCIYSFKMYLEHFLHELPQTEIKFMSDSYSIALTHFINHVSSLDQFITQVVSEKS